METFLGEIAEAQPNNHKRYITLAAIGVLGVGGAVAAFGYVAKQHDMAASTTYAQNYTDVGRCLDNSPYDPANGATMVQHDMAGETVLTILPPHPENTTPATLNFLVNYSSLGLQANLLPADYATGGLLAKDCGYTTGY